MNFNNNSFLFLILTIYFTIINFKICFCQNSWIFAVDISPSMWNDIIAVKTTINNIVTDPSFTDPQNYILSLFHDTKDHDPGATDYIQAEATYYDNYDAFKTALDNLDKTLEGGNVCEEATFSGIYEALIKSVENGITSGDVFVFTDASSYQEDYDLVGAEFFGSLEGFSISFINSDSCTYPDSLDTNFVEIADDYGGFTLATTSTEIYDALDVVKLFLSTDFNTDGSVDLAPEIKVSTIDNIIYPQLSEDTMLNGGMRIFIASADFGDYPNIDLTFSYGSYSDVSVEDRFEIDVYEGQGFYALVIDLDSPVDGSEYTQEVELGETWVLKVTFDTTQRRLRRMQTSDSITNLFTMYSTASDASVSFELFDIDSENNFVLNQNGFLTKNLDLYDSFAVYVSSSDSNVVITDISIVSTDGLSVVTKSGSDVIYDDSESGYYSIFSFDELDTVLNDDLKFRLRAKGTDNDGVTFTRIYKTVIRVTSLTVELDCNDATFKVGTDTSCDITIYRSETDATESDTFDISVKISNSYLRNSDDTVTLIYDSDITLDAGETQGSLTLTLSFEDNDNMVGQTFSLTVFAKSNSISSNKNYDVEGEFTVTGSIFGIEPTQCENDPCKCNEVINCRVCNEGSGCAQCNGGYFKIDYEYQCQSCSETFGSYCMFCQDFNGCGQCKDGSTRTKDDDTNLWYCKTESDDSDTTDTITITDTSHSDCSVELTLCESYRCTLNNEDPNCATMETWGCRKCNDGYFIETRDYPCVACNQIEGCLNCIDWNGCNECDSGYTKKWNSDCDFYTCV